MTPGLYDGENGYGGLLNNAETHWPHIAGGIESMGHAEQEQLIGRLAI